MPPIGQVLLADADCCFTPVIAPADLLAEPQVRARGMVGISERGVPWMRSPLRLGKTAANPGEAPAQGQQTRQLLAEMGYPEAETDRLQAQGIILQTHSSR